MEAVPYRKARRMRVSTRTRRMFGNTARKLLNSRGEDETVSDGVREAQNHQRVCASHRQACRAMEILLETKLDPSEKLDSSVNVGANQEIWCLTVQRVFSGLQVFSVA